MEVIVKFDTKSKNNIIYLQYWLKNTFKQL